MNPLPSATTNYQLPTTNYTMRQRLHPVGVTLPSHGVFVLESRHAPGFTMAASRHDFLELFYVLDGAGEFAVGGRRQACGPGDVVVVPAGVFHRIADRPDGPLSLYGICVGAAVCGVDPDVAAVPPGRLAHAPLVARHVRDTLRLMLFEQTMARPGHRATVVGLTLQLLGLLARGAVERGTSRPAATTAADSLAAVRGYVDELPHRFFEPTDLDAAASSLGLSRRRFTALFRAVTGTTWLDHLTALRVDYAARLLRDGARSVTAVAFETGFEDLSSFYRVFKRRMGQPPNEWRAQARDRV